MPQNTTRRTFVGLAAAACGALTASPKTLIAQPGGSAGSYLDILRYPDLAVAYSGLEHRIPLTRANDSWTAGDVAVRTPVKSSAEVSVYVASPKAGLTHLHLRWNLKAAPGLRVLGDAWERSYGDLEWRGFVPDRPMPWYFLTFDGTRLNGYGVRTAAGALCFWQLDPEGVSLWADLRNGGNPVELGSRELHAATVVTRLGTEGESAFESARLFCHTMCAEPRLPDGPIYGSNDWNYAYGKNTAQGLLRDADLIASLAPRGPHPPLVVIDDGWQDKARFPDMAALATGIRSRKLRPGLWIRPTRAPQQAKASLLLSAERFEKGPRRNELTYDPTIPEAMEAILDSVRGPVSWGYELLKHDFSTYELLGQWGFEMGPSPTREGWGFADRSRTNAEILLAFYQALRRTAGDKVQLLGCNTVGHLSAGLFESQRIGDDTSGRYWERTRRMGVNTLAFRNPQHHTFFHIDPDCVSITTQVKWSDTRQWLDLVSRTGTSLFVSPQPEATGPEQRAAIKEAFALVASSRGYANDWLEDTTPQNWQFGKNAAEKKTYDWSSGEGMFPFKV